MSKKSGGVEGLFLKALNKNIHVLTKNPII